MSLNCCRPALLPSTEEGGKLQFTQQEYTPFNDICIQVPLQDTTPPAAREGFCFTSQQSHKYFQSMNLKRSVSSHLLVGHFKEFKRCLLQVVGSLFDVLSSF